MKKEPKIGGLGGRILILEQYAKQMVITKPHTKFELSSSKHLEVIQSWNLKKGGTDDDNNNDDDDIQSSTLGEL